MLKLALGPENSRTSVGVCHEKGRHGSTCSLIQSGTYKTYRCDFGRRRAFLNPPTIDFVMPIVELALRRGGARVLRALKLGLSAARSGTLGSSGSAPYVAFDGAQGNERGRACYDREQESLAGPPTAVVPHP